MRTFFVNVHQFIESGNRWIGAESATRAAAEHRAKIARMLGARTLYRLKVTFK